jgi:SDR family mycofactocin-dependent oxidoreductase
VSRRVSIVIGAGRGIGAACAVRLAAQGDAVVLVDRGGDDPRLPYPMASATDLADAVAAARAVAPDPSHVRGEVADATDARALEAVVAGAEEEHGGLDAVIVTAGVVAGGVPLWQMPEPELHAVFAGNLDAVIVAARVGIPALLRREPPRTGRFVAVASTAATRGLPMLAAYCAAKAGVTGLVRALGAELRGTDVTANCVSPGSTDTVMLEESARLYGLDGPGAFASQQPIERLIAPDEVAAVIAWLAGPQSGAVTGADHAVDGGLAI